MQEYLEIGQIVNTFGIKGEVKVSPFTDDITRFDTLKQVYIEKNQNKESFRIIGVKYHKNMVILKLEGIEDINEADKYKNCYLKINRKDAIDLPENTYFIVDLIGIEVYSDEEKLLGKIEDIYSNGANDIYVVKDELGKQILLPAIKEVIKNIDLDQKKVMVHLMKGLID